MPTIADKGLLLASLAGKYLGGLNPSDSCSSTSMKSPPSCWKGGLFSLMSWAFYLIAYDKQLRYTRNQTSF